jgi:hypothetical protein
MKSSHGKVAIDGEEIKVGGWKIHPMIGSVYAGLFPDPMFIGLCFVGLRETAGTYVTGFGAIRVSLPVNPLDRLEFGDDHDHN